MSATMYKEKATEALSKNFVQVSSKTCRVKTKAIAMCNGMQLPRLASDIRKCKKGTLDVFFVVKTHKPHMPFRCIVSERGTWLQQVSSFLFDHLRGLELRDPFLTKNSTDVIAFLKKKQKEIGFLFSIDVEDLFYSVPHTELFNSVRECIECNGTVAFQNSVGISVDKFMSLLEFYLRATVVSFDSGLFVQKKGICIGSCVAPVLCNIFLSSIDRDLESTFDKGTVLQIFRYVDDFLVVLAADFNLTYDNTVQSVLCYFKNLGKGLSFTHEVPLNNSLQFLDINIRCCDGNVCWMYSPRAKKELLPYNSSHSKTVKRAIGSLCLESALTKSCEHMLETSFTAQIERLKNAGFPSSVLSAVAETLLQKMKGKKKTKQTGPEQRIPQVLPYTHRVAHGLKKVAFRFGVSVVFSAPRKLGGLCARIGKKKKFQCEAKHGKVFVKCVVGVVYAIPLTCGMLYIGQTGRCVNFRAWEHFKSLEKGTGSNLALHCKQCNCKPLLNEIKILGKSHEKLAREILEAFHIAKSGEACCSDSSVTLRRKENTFLESCL
nr:uncharacterized protein LOC119180841 [Rhipicephalus microplus]